MPRVGNKMARIYRLMRRMGKRWIAKATNSIYTNWKTSGFETKTGEFRNFVEGTEEKNIKE